MGELCVREKTGVEALLIGVWFKLLSHWIEMLVTQPLSDGLSLQLYLLIYCYITFKLYCYINIMSY